jgi:hypothetical protein
VHAACRLLLISFHSRTSCLGQLLYEITRGHASNLRALVSCAYILVLILRTFQGLVHPKNPGVRGRRGPYLLGDVRRLTQTWFATSVVVSPREVLFGGSLWRAGRGCGFMASRDDEIARLQWVVRVSRYRFLIVTRLTPPSIGIQP